MSEQQRKRLRKQPKRRRAQSVSSVNVPRMQLPKTAQRRKRRKKTEPVRFGLSSLKRIIFSSRWISLALLAVSIYALVDIYDEQRFYLTYIPVEGAIAISPEEIAEASGLAGSHVFAVDPSEAANQISQLPGVISSTVTLQWPNQVYIQVAEEAPVAIWVENGEEFGITAAGRLIPAVRTNPTMLQIESELDDQGSPTDSSGSSGAQSDQKRGIGGITTPNTALKEQESQPALAFVPREVVEGALLLRELRPSIDKLYYEPSGGLSYQDERGWRGYFGTGNEMNQRLAVYETIVADLLSKGIQPEYISVSNQVKPFYRAAGYIAPQTDDAEQG